MAERIVGLWQLANSDDPAVDDTLIGLMIDNGVDPPFGDTDAAKELLAPDPRGRWDFFAAGWSNGYFETELEPEEIPDGEPAAA